MYRRHRKTRYRASPYPDTQSNRLRGYSVNDANSLAALRRNTLGSMNQSGGNSHGSNSNDSYILLRQLAEAFHEEVATMPSPIRA